MGLDPAAALPAPAAGGPRGRRRHYLAGANTRRLRGAPGPLLRAAPLSKSADSRIAGTLKAEPEAWRTRSLAELITWAWAYAAAPILSILAIARLLQSRFLGYRFAFFEVEILRRPMAGSAADGAGRPSVE